MRSVKTLARGLFACAVVAVMMLSGPHAAAEASSLVALTNQQRASHDLPALTVSNELMDSAEAKARDMLSDNYWSHDAPDGNTPWDFIKGAGYSYRYAGENLAKGFDTDSGVIKGLMNSEAHRANILKPEYTQIGVAEVRGELQGEKVTLIVFHYATPKQNQQAIGTQNSSITNMIADFFKHSSHIFVTTTSLTKHLWLQS